MEASWLLHSYGDRESMSHGKKARNPNTSIQTHRSLVPSRTRAFDFEYFPNMDHMVLNNPPYGPYPFPISSSLPRHNSYPYPYPPRQFDHQLQQPPLLPLPVTNKKLPNKGRPQKHSSRKTKKTPDSKSVLGEVGNTKRWGPDPESDRLKSATKEMNFYESLIFAMSPPPSSLPMPKFTILKPKLSKVVR